MNTRISTTGLIDEDARRRFESAWIRGCPQPLEDYLPAQDAPSYFATLEELVLVELEFAWKSWTEARTKGDSQQPKRIAHYRERFPALDRPEVLHHLLREELRVRLRWGDNPTAAEYGEEFGTVAQTDSEFTGSSVGFVSAWDELPRLPGYEIYGLLGRGGMGLVWKAKQLSLGRIVALKMIWLGGSARSEDIARLRTEAEAVARLQHPNVVQIHEVAEHNGVPYLTLEYVNAGNLATWSASKPQPHRTAARLISTLAQAIHHAHQRGIIHRDLKPANILLLRTDGSPTEDGLLAGDGSTLVPKIADFGLAKVLGEAQAQQTQTGAAIGTPSYMAPEQTGGRQQDIGIPTDVYALGAILFELLIGTPPFRASTALETLEQVRSQEPAISRKGQPKVPLDLETICLTCLAKDPSKRYGSAQALAEDLNRYLAGEPVMARPPSAREQIQKWIRRRPAWAALIAVSAAAVLTLVSVVLADNVRLQHQRDVADSNQRKADEQRQLAVAHLHEARDAVDRLLTRVGLERLESVPYMETVRLELLKDALQFYEGFAQKESADPELRLETGRAWRRLGKIHEQLGDQKVAEQSFRSALTIVLQLQAESPADETILRELAACEQNLGNSLVLNQGDRAEARRASLKAVEIQEMLRADQALSPESAQSLAESYDLLARSFDSSGQPQEAEKAFRQAVAVLERVATKSSSPQLHDMSLASRKRNLGVFLALHGRLNEAEPFFRSDRDFWERLALESPGVVRFQRRSADAAFNLGCLLADSGHPKDAEACLRRAIEFRQRLVDEYPKVSGMHDELARGQERLARLFRSDKNHQAASPLLELAISHLEACQKLNALSASRRVAQASCHLQLADSRLELADYQTAAKLAEKVSPICPDRWQECSQAARLLTRCVIACQKDGQLPESLQRENIEMFSRRSVEILRESNRRGSKEFDLIKTDPTLDVLRTREDFKRLLADLAEKH